MTPGQVLLILTEFSEGSPSTDKENMRNLKTMSEFREECKSLDFTDKSPTALTWILLGSMSWCPSRPKHGLVPYYWW